jgi:hypothetical protein
MARRAIVDQRDPVGRDLCDMRRDVEIAAALAGAIPANSARSSSGQPRVRWVPVGEPSSRSITGDRIRCILALHRQPHPRGPVAMAAGG